MGTVAIRTRILVSGGRTYHVRYRVGGRATRVRHGGAFPTMKEAKAREAFIRQEIAAGRDPAVTLRQLVSSPLPSRTLTAVAAEFAGSRHDVQESTRDGYRGRIRQLDQMIGRRDPLSLTAADIRDVVAQLTARKLAPGTVRLYLTTLRQVLDFAGCDPNPARDSTVKLPRGGAASPTVPTAANVAAVLSTVSTLYRLPLRVCEQTGMRMARSSR